MKIGDSVKIVKCDVCPKVIGKTAKVTRVIFTEEQGKSNRVEVKFGKGRPQKNRPILFGVDDVVISTLGETI